ncbi:hypothetical protein Tco_0502778, partial [Tanacetum coccineum]
TVEHDNVYHDQERASIACLIDNLQNEVARCNEVNNEAKALNASLTKELESYRKRANVFEKGVTREHSFEVAFQKSFGHEKELKRELNEVIRANNQKISNLENKYLDEIVDLQHKLKDFENVVYMTGQSIQVINAHSCQFVDGRKKFALGYNHPHFLKKALNENPKLYSADSLKDPNVCVVVYDDEEQWEQEAETRERFTTLNASNYQSPYVLETRKIFKTEFEPHVAHLHLYATHFDLELQQEVKVMMNIFQTVETEFSKTKRKNKSFENEIDRILEAVMITDIIKTALRTIYSREKSSIKGLFEGPLQVTSTEISFLRLEKENIEFERKLDRKMDDSKAKKYQFLKQIASLESNLASQDHLSLQKEYNDLRISYNPLKVKFDSLNRSKGKVHVSNVLTLKVSVSEKVYMGESSKSISKRVSQFTTYSLQKDRKFSKRPSFSKTFTPQNISISSVSNGNNQVFQTPRSRFTPVKQV